MCNLVFGLRKQPCGSEILTIRKRKITQLYRNAPLENFLLLKKALEREKRCLKILVVFFVTKNINSIFYSSKLKASLPKMPQVDKVTFTHIINWLSTFYICGYGLATLSTFYKFFNLFKIYNKRLLLAYYQAQVCSRYIVTLTKFPWFTF